MFQKSSSMAFLAFSEQALLAYFAGIGS